MKHRWSRRGALATAIAGVLIGGAATADHVANMQVTANVAPSCLLNSVPTIAFGTLNPLANNDAQGNITWVCTNGFNTVIRLGGGSSGNINARAMTGPGTVRISCTPMRQGHSFSATAPRATQSQSRESATRARPT